MTTLRVSPSGPFEDVDTGGAGLLVAPSISTPPPVPTDPPALVDVDATVLPSGAIANVQSVGALFELDQAPSAELLAAVDGVTIVAPTVPGPVWTRRTHTTNTRWASQPAWELDVVNGSDDGPGTPGQPLRTMGELCRRLYRARIRSSVTVDVLAGDLSADAVQLDLDIAQATTVLLRGALTSVADVLAVSLPNVAGAAATNAGAQRAAVTATAATFADRGRLRITDGAAIDGLAWVTRVPTPGPGGVANVFRWGRMANPLTSTVVTNLTPAAGAGYVLDTFESTIGALDLRARGPGRIVLEDLHIRPGATVTWAHRAEGDNGNSNGVLAYGCRFSSASTLLFLGGVWTMALCQLAPDGTAGTAGQIVFSDGGFFSLRMCTLTGSSVQSQVVCSIRDGSIIQQDSGACFDGVQLIGQRGAVWDQIGSTPNDSSWVDNTQAHVMEIAQGGTYWAHSSGNRLWGLDNVLTGAAFLVQGSIRYNDTPSVPGGTVDVNVGGATGTYAAAIPLLDATFPGAGSLMGT